MDRVVHMCKTVGWQRRMAHPTFITIVYMVYVHYWCYFPDYKVNLLIFVSLRDGRKERGI